MTAFLNDMKLAIERSTSYQKGKRLTCFRIYMENTEESIAFLSADDLRELKETIDEALQDVPSDILE